MTLALQFSFSIFHWAPLHVAFNSSPTFAKSRDVQLPNDVIDWAALVLCFRQELCSNLGAQSSYSDGEFLHLSSFPTGK
jgi:hypothetical protein